MQLSLNCINVKGAMKALEHDIMVNISLASDQEAYRMRRESLESQWLKKKEEIGRLDDLISDKILRAGRIDAFIEEMQNLNAIKEFSAQAWGVMVESDGEAGRGDRFFLHRREQGQGIKRQLGELGWFLRRFCCSNSMFRKKLDSIISDT